MFRKWGSRQSRKFERLIKNCSNFSTIEITSMALFSFFKTPRHQKFEYKPRFYDPQKEKVEQILRNARGEGSSDTELAKTRIASTFQRRSKSHSSTKRAMRKSNFLLLAIIVILFGVTYMLLTVYLPEFIDLFED